jgi:hypothetical protein
MEFFEAKAPILNKGGTTIEEVLGMDAERMSACFAHIAAPLLVKIKAEEITNTAQIMEFVASYEFFSEFIFTSGFLHFMSTLDSTVDMISKERE